jgi:hypothetical protein
MTRHKVVKETFKTLDQFLEITKQRPLNAVFQSEKERLSSQRDETYKGGDYWSGTATYQDAENVMLNGYKDPLDRMKKAILKIGQQDQQARPRTRNDFVGFAPNVPNYLSNLPINMINRDRIAPKINTIHLTYSICTASKTKPEDMIKGGINFISLVNSLEKQGYRVKIDVVFSTVSNGTTATVLFTLKEYSQATNLLKLAFPLVHPAMLRRFAFKWLETTPELKEHSFTHGYGTPLNYVVGHNLEKERKHLKDRDIIKGNNSYYCNVYTALKAKTVEELATRMEILK